MKILLTANLVPFLHGGAEYHIANLAAALREAGHALEVLRLPFRFGPDDAVEQAMAHAAAIDMHRPNGVEIDRVISLQFPGWGVAHPEHHVWVMHQHRAVYDLYAEAAATPSLRRLRERVIAFDNAGLGRARRRFANSQRVAQRLWQYNQIEAEPLYHPPPLAGQFRCEAALPFIFMPSRLETLKRQALLVEAAARLRAGLSIVLAGTGGQMEMLRQRIEALGVGHRVALLGEISEQEKLHFYARALAVCFPARDEDYGYVPLEAMLSSKPVVVCSDGGGPLEFVRHGENGWVVPPDPDALAATLEAIAARPAQAAEMGVAGRQMLLARGIGWEHVVATLTS
ncbi:Putative glycosyltransferase [Cupriavidus taiwanensis]|uniref:Glycosyltransferase n=1 Tax=Cupriavidus taiwanensis TaxID=164546 RepID=A0A375E8P9_9BURK|nr:glycosyltransferase family 4 protein [Cupriavidus taiwanensis]SOZ67330.1 Putative glycosyltransferase [Cupriavidus taiwanensis]SOZ68555.1 Putative glycosyltransferase [Cupriavidus taiwanensis]SOZ71587.1 Putative glycosyltransferase [Cupriavidus taiwanensis]SPA09390.1 Putative glycosyltransferase [Cupriavidus taiwanensis]